MNLKETKVMADVKYQARENYVVIRRQKFDRVRGLAMPDISNVGKQFVVESVGPKVEGLKEGDEVMILGQKGQEYADLPGEPDLLVIDARLVPYVIHRTKEE